MHKSSGNVLFLILIAVALFAALSYAVTQSTRSGGGDATAEKNNLTMSAKMQYLAQLQSTIQRMKLSGCADTDISFRGTTTSWNYNAFGPVVTTANAKCNVFEKEGGGMVRPQNPPPYLSTATGISGIGSNNAEMLWVEVMGEEPGLCRELYKTLYNQSLPTTTKDWSQTAFIGPAGSFTDYAVLDDPTVNGRHTSCFNNPDYGGWYFYYVLIER